MDVTNKTWEEIFKEIASKGVLWAAITIAVIAFLLGGFLVALYFTKIRHFQLQNELSSCRSELKNAKDESARYIGSYQKLIEQIKEERDVEINQLKAERDKYITLYERLKVETKNVEDDVYVHLATKPDEPDHAVQSIFE